MNVLEHRQDVLLAVRRTALIFQHFAETIVAELGEEQGRELIRKAIDAYGTQIGTEARERTLAKQLELIPENYQDDLPSVGWESATVMRDGQPVEEVHVCPLADCWHSMEPSLARLYCYVDQAKMHAYNPEFEYVHLANILSGAPCCVSVIRKK